MTALLDSAGQPILDTYGAPTVLQDFAGQVILDSLGQPITTGTAGLELLDSSIASIPSITTTDTNGMASRILAVLPGPWFADDAPVLGTVLQGLGAVWADVYQTISFAKLQTRIAAATGAFLDTAARDYLGGLITRKPGQGDAAFSVRIRREIIRQRVTRAGVIQALADLTGRAPKVFEPAQPGDTGGYGYLGMTVGTGLAYGGAGAAGMGGYGSLALPSQWFVTAYRAGGGGIANVAGYYSGWGGGGYGVGAIEYGQLSMSQGQITDADIYAQAAAVMPAASIGWMAISN